MLPDVGLITICNRGTYTSRDQDLRLHLDSIPQPVEPTDFGHIFSYGVNRQGPLVREDEGAKRVWMFAPIMAQWREVPAPAALPDGTIPLIKQLYWYYEDPPKSRWMIVRVAEAGTINAKRSANDRDM